VVVLIDANLAAPEPCRLGCNADASHLCRHRFGRQVRIIARRDPIMRSGTSDLDILRFLVKLARNGIRGASVDESWWLILSKDATFCNSAKHEYDSRRGREREHLDFYYRCAVARVNGRPLHIEIVRCRGAHAREQRHEALRIVREYLAAY
jgi:hypothetical protein